MNEIWKAWAGVLSAPICDAIITECEKYDPQDATIGVDGVSAEENSEVKRSSIVRWVDRNKQSSHFVVNIIKDFAWEANRRAFGFHVDYLRDIQFTEYHGSQEGEYGWHFDTFWGNPTTYDRKLSVVIQLSDPTDYEGGEFQIDPQFQKIPEEFKQRGSILVFPSPIRHRVTPVTSGLRKSLVSWIEGPKFK
jgi:PKHD-type hydroxylase